ncbi:hypothetical protein IQ268_30580 [Oculatella sp. LEGE 06141]|uniref:hypothetical protein n=1 Tax=Oculatella sp. LEGE 06141 TaxID=1828648 RepID=UPI00187FA1D6|nr:hypothetical protein [Oculatella sp. LEGE 06141]MBE9182885.1 hypothetical protein [Oculatella sp. LEGE 06141]
MGIMTSWTGSKSSKVSHYGGHALRTSNVLDGVSDAINPTTAVNWQTNNPTVRHELTTATIAEADQAEREAAAFDAAVDNGCRVLKAEAKRQQAHAKLVKGHRQYLGATAQSHFEVASANRGLAGKLHGLRESYAQLGYSLDRKEVTVNQKVEMIANKYRGV